MCSHRVLEGIHAASMVSIAGEAAADSRELQREGLASASTGGALERGSHAAP